MEYLIPANSKAGQLIFGFMNKFDLFLVSGGVCVSVLFLVLFKPETFSVALFCMLPLLVTGFLIVPVPNYHNILTLIIEMIHFFYNRRNYKWKGWCYKDEFK